VGDEAAGPEAAADGGSVIVIFLFTKDFPTPRIYG
jgi:hypothetical protein